MSQKGRYVAKADFESAFDQSSIIYVPFHFPLAKEIPSQKDVSVTDISTTIAKKADQVGSNTKNSEDWIVFPFKNQLFVHAQRDQEIDDKIFTSEKNGWCPQYTAILALGRLSDLNDMGFVYVYVTSDADPANVAHLLQRFVKVGERKSFGVASINVPHSLEECLSTFGIERNASNKFSTAQFKPLLLQ
jgi:hypothetical protein